MACIRKFLPQFHIIKNIENFKLVTNGVYKNLNRNISDKKI